MEWRLALLLFSGFAMECVSIPHHFIFVNMSKTWTEAQHYCREQYTDLATIENMEDMQMMIDTAKGYDGKAWIGLHQTDVPSWKWSLADEHFYGPGKANFTNWRQGEPNGGDDEECASRIRWDLWNDIRCNAQQPFVCYDEKHSGDKRYVFIDEKKSWREAQKYCRENHTDLVSVRDEEENQLINETAKIPWIWIGLFRDDWTWSDQRMSSFRHWRPDAPDNKGKDNCAVTWLTQGNKGTWKDCKCDDKHPFFCRLAVLYTTHAVNPSLTTVIQSVGGNSDSEAATSQLASTNSPAPSTLSTAPNLTSLMPSTVDRQTQEPSTALSLPAVTTPETSSSSSSAVPAGSTLNELQLVKENLSWTEAHMYCRERHMDLVSVFTEEIQRWVMEEAKRASTEQVWLGLRYLCPLDIWFWVSGETVCWDGWAEERGKEEREKEEREKEERGKEE
ncbi:macrophage mannose receptor 1-like, partial [Alosa pseudoharengus]|uniref:macrophage mannose receptor 1-like n=1 Tax=Alosa pseudoharengus TaxID=34774 RepID=UPI003F8BCC81